MLDMTDLDTFPLNMNSDVPSQRKAKWSFKIIHETVGVFIHARGSPSSTGNSQSRGASPLPDILAGKVRITERLRDGQKFIQWVHVPNFSDGDDKSEDEDDEPAEVSRSTSLESKRNDTDATWQIVDGVAGSTGLPPPPIPPRASSSSSASSDHPPPKLAPPSSATPPPIPARSPTAPAPRLNGHAPHRHSGNSSASPRGPSSTSSSIPPSISFEKDSLAVSFCATDPPVGAGGDAGGDDDEVDDEEAMRRRGISPTSKSLPLAKRYETLIRFEIDELRSIKRSPQDCSWSYLVLILADGTTLPALHFHDGGSSAFVAEIQKLLVVRQSSCDSRLFLVTSAEADQRAMIKSFDELNLFPESAPNLITKLVHDPVTTTLGGFSRVTNFLREQMGPPKGSRSYRNELPDPFSDLPNLMFTSPQDDPDFEIITRIDRNSPNDPTDPSSGRGSASSGADNATPTVDGQNSPWTSRRHSPKVLEELPPRPEVVRGLPITSAEWSKNMNSEGRVQNVESLKQQIFRGGVDPPLRIEVWKFLLGYYDYKSTYKERQEQRKTRVDDYFRMKLQWKSLSSDQESRFSALKDRKALIEKDVNRTDRTHRFFQGEKNPNLDVLSDILMTYVMYNFDLGYVQGMSDLLAPVLVVMENEVDAFWCFAGFMEIIGKNFEMDQSTMKLQMTQLHAIIEFVDPQLMQYLENHESGNLYFCFRWLLIHFKREFSFPDVMRLWETLWTGHPCRNFHLLVCVALLDNEKSVLVENEFGFTEILKHINDLSGTIDIESLLKKAEGIFLQIAGCRSPPRMVAEILGLEAMLCPSLPSQSAISPKIKARGSNAFSTPSPQPSLSRTKSPSPTGSSTPHSSIEVLGTQSDDDDDVMV